MSRAALVYCTALALTLLAEPAAGQGQELINGLPPQQGKLRTFPGTALIIPDQLGAVPPPKTVVWHDTGGLISKHDARWIAIGTQGGEVEILGMCQSACTMVTARIPKHRLCFGKDAYLNFHMARLSVDGPPAIEDTKWMISVYPDDIRKWINARGGLENMPYEGFWRLPASELWKMGYRRCGD